MKTKGDYAACLEGVILQRPVTDFLMSNKGHILSLICLLLPFLLSVTSNPNFRAPDSKSHSKKRSQIIFLNME